MLRIPITVVGPGVLTTDDLGDSRIVVGILKDDEAYAAVAAVRNGDKFEAYYLDSGVDTRTDLRRRRVRTWLREVTKPGVAVETTVVPIESTDRSIAALAALYHMVLCREIFEPSTTDDGGWLSQSSLD